LPWCPEIAPPIQKRTSFSLARSAEPRRDLDDGLATAAVERKQVWLDKMRKHRATNRSVLAHRVGRLFFAQV
jgi:hypothetical protein